MSTSTTIKADHESIAAYYEALQAYAEQDVIYETAVRSACHRNPTPGDDI